MKHTLQDVAVLLGLPIDGQTIKSIGVHNRIALCKQSFGLTPFLFFSKLKGVAYVLSGLMRHFRHHQIIVMERSYGGTKSIMI